ncbi:MAG: adenylyl-sulfate kinase [Mariprofundaceae bacterium]|nr:adenylyl-sulfate kinase [Mariprofundaceae bacterium]
MSQVSENIYWEKGHVSRQNRENLNKHKGVVLWFTGLSGSGKSTVAHAVEEVLHQHSVRTFVVDGDNVRHGLCSDLGFSDDDRIENIRRVGELAKLFVSSGTVVLTAFISPFIADRDKVRQLLGQDFIEIYCACSLEKCESRDVKGLYKRARVGEIADFTGISSPYEAPVSPDIVIDTEKDILQVCVAKIVRYLEKRDVVLSVI